MPEARRAPSGGPTFTMDYLGEVDGKTVLQSSQEQKAKDGRKDCFWGCTAGGQTMAEPAV